MGKVTVEMNLIDDMDNYYDTQTEQYCINGHYGCWGDEELYTNVGNVPEKKPCEHKSNTQLQKNANFAIEYDGQDKITVDEEEYDEVAEIIKSVSVVNEDKVEKNSNHHDKKKFGVSTAITDVAGNGGKGNGNKRDESEKKDYAQNGEADSKKDRKRDRKKEESVNA